MRLLIVGSGKMGAALRGEAAARGHEVVGVLGSHENAKGGGIAAFAGKADVAIEFSVPSAAADNVRACVQAGIPVVVGTTGWENERASVEEFVWAQTGAAFIAPNFSIGVAMLLSLAKLAGQLVAAHPDFDVALLDVHHTHKKDAPSGTAKAVARTLEESLGKAVPVTSVRVGEVPGTHTIVIDGTFEQITIQHEARDRRTFAQGALRAAEWLVGRTGVFGMPDLLARPRSER